ncbi:MAG TPA: DUF6603 domain-containing protein [Streptosporangiaceae bacterium]|nr:DUF6603 domain-containing protein [Streptosporangiaceae bacterium]
MSGDSSGTVEQLAAELALMFAPLAQRAADGTTDLLLEWLGLRASDVTGGSAELATALATGVTAAASMPATVDDLVTAIEADDVGAVATAAESLLHQFATVVKAANDGATALQGLSSDLSLTAQQSAEVAQFADEFVERLLGRLLVEYLQVRFPALLLALVTTGVVEVVQVDGGPDGSLNASYLREMVHFDRLTQLFSGPEKLLGDVYGWGNASFDGLALFTTLQTLLNLRFDIPAEILQPAGDPALLEAFGFSAEVDPTLSPPGLTISVRLPAGVNRTDTVATDDWNVAIATAATFNADIQAVLRPLFDLQVTAASGTVDVQFSISFARSATAAPFLLLGQAGGSRLELASPTASVGLELHLDSATDRVTLDPQLSVGLQGGKLLISSDGGDGFIATLLAGARLESDFNANLTWSPSRGAQFTGSATLEIALPVHLDLGPVEVQTIYLVAGLAGGSVPVELSVGLSAALGPLQASVDRMGAIATLSLPAGGGNLGPADIAFAFKPPNGVGLSIDAGVVSGGGFLYIDPAKGEYAGAVQLKFADFLALGAIGLIDTKLPDGSSGFSLLIIITADFGAGLELGFGFTLNAVGGLLGVNRTMLFQPLMDGVRTGAIDSIMFPQDIVANAPKIISDLRAIFPPQQGTFLIGPMAKLGWGEPTLVSLSLGIIVEIPPGDIAILGVLELALPAEDLAILVLQVNFAGALEFDKQRMYFFASLYDSHILFITIEGEMGLLFAWGSNANFVVTVGGFHPQYNPPPLPFPSPQRISVDIINESYARIRADGYFAVTTNTVQFGAHAEFFFGFSAVSVTGSAGFDALIQFSPFHFIVSVSASFSANVFGIGVFSIGIDVTLEGPEPWHAHGTASISFLFFSIGIGIDFTWGDSGTTTLPPVTVMPILSAEFGKQSNWRALPPTGSNLLVSLRQLSASESQLVLHPVGTLQVSQRLIPLDLTLDTVGSQKPDDANRFSLSVSSPDLAKTATLTEPFAPSQFKTADDATKLSQPAYAPQDSGIEMSPAGQQYASATTIVRIVRDDVTIIDTKLRRSSSQFTYYPGTMFQHGLRGNAAARSTLSGVREQQTHPFDGSVQVSPETFAVARQADNAVYRPEAAAFTSQASARDYLDRAVTADPTLAGALHILPQFEVAP